MNAKILRLWHEAGGKYSNDPQLYDILTIRDTDLERFFNLAVAAEREACAVICDQYVDGRYANMAGLCADAIRTRTALGVLDIIKHQLLHDHMADEENT